MGQQTTIAYVAPDSSSMMGYTVQKADGTCVGSDCSTYLINWSNGAGNNNNWASNITPSLSSQMKAGQHWTMTIQNAGLGYNGFLSSPSGQGLPEANGSTPAGAQFKLETQNEITYQPPWAVVTETIVGEVIAIVVLSVATGGAADAPLIEEGIAQVTTNLVAAGAPAIEMEALPVIEVAAAVGDQSVVEPVVVDVLPMVEVALASGDLTIAEEGQVIITELLVDVQDLDASFSLENDFWANLSVILEEGDVSEEREWGKKGEDMIMKSLAKIFK